MQAVIHKGRPTYAYPAQMDTDIWYVQRPDGKYEPCTQAELRFVAKGHASERCEMLADPAATDWSVLEKAFDASIWGLVITVALLIAIAWGVTMYGWYVTVKAITGAVAVLIIWWSARRM